MIRTRSALLLASALGLSVSTMALADDTFANLKDMVQKQAQQQAEAKLSLPQAAPAGAKASIVSPLDGATVTSPVHVQFGLTGMGVAPAGVNQANTGHFHLLIDSPQIDMTKPIPGNSQVIHYGGGQIEANVKLSPGTHTLQLLMGDWKHLPQQPAILSDKITITVK